MLKRKPKTWQGMFDRKKFDPPLMPSYSAFHLPDGSLNTIGRLYYMREAAKRMAERKREREKNGETY